MIILWVLCISINLDLYFISPIQTLSPQNQIQTSLNQLEKSYDKLFQKNFSLLEKTWEINNLKILHLFNSLEKEEQSFIYLKVLTKKITTQQTEENLIYINPPDFLVKKTGSSLYLNHSLYIKVAYPSFSEHLKQIDWSLQSPSIILVWDGKDISLLNQIQFICIGTPDDVNIIGNLGLVLHL